MFFVIQNEHQLIIYNKQYNVTRKTHHKLDCAVCGGNINVYNVRSYYKEFIPLVGGFIVLRSLVNSIQRFQERIIHVRQVACKSIL